MENSTTIPVQQYKDKSINNYFYPALCQLIEFSSKEVSRCNGFFFFFPL